MSTQLLDFTLTGNIVPPIWYKRITFDNGKPQMLAINILADIVYWYRPIEIRDERTGQIKEYRKKFKADLLQRSYKQICDFFGCSEKQAKDSLRLLERMGLIERVVRLVKLEGNTFRNCLYIKLNVEKVKEISFLSADELCESASSPHSS